MIIKNFTRCFASALIIVAFLLSSSSCSVFRSLKKDEHNTQTDSTNLRKQTELTNTIDTSKSKSTYSKETITFYPQRDTVINNIIIPKTSNPYPVYITKETGTNEIQNYNYETRQKQIIDSMRIANLEMQLNQRTEIKSSVLSPMQLIGLSIFGLIIITMIVLFAWITKKVNVISQIIKSK